MVSVSSSMETTVSPEAFTTKDFFEAEETLPRLRGDFDFIIVTPGVMDADCNEKLISCVLFYI